MSFPRPPQDIEVKHSTMDILLGNEKTNSLENRVFNVVGILVILIGIFTALLNYFSGNPIREMVISLVVIAAAIVFYIASIKFYKDRYLRIPMALFFLGILSIAWITNQGSQGNTPLFFIILFVASVIILPFPYKVLVLGLSFAVVIALLMVERYNPTVILPYLSESHRFLDVSVSLIISLIINTLLVHLVVKEYQKERVRSEMLYKQTLRDKAAIEQALANIKILEGILPVCSFCKKIRDENNEWQAIEHYISSHSQAEFTHGFCPDCVKKHYPDFLGKQQI